MTRGRPWSAVRGASIARVLLLAATACSGEGAGAPWLTNATPATHSAFPLTAGPHAGTDCNQCHGPFATFAQFTCLGCHEQPATDPLHPGVAGYQYASGACYSCHRDGTASFPDHATKFFPIGAGTAHFLACADCHAVPGDRTQVACVTCHVGSHDQATSAGQHAPVAAYQWSDPLCLRCHADGTVQTIAAHTPFVIAPGASHGTNCLLCHPATRADKPWGADFTPPELSCYLAGCHDSQQVQQLHVGRVASFPAGDSQACAGCHPSGRGGT